MPPFPAMTRSVTRSGFRGDSVETYRARVEVPPDARVESPRPQYDLECIALHRSIFLFSMREPVITQWGNAADFPRLGGLDQILKRRTTKHYIHVFVFGTHPAPFSAQCLRKRPLPAWPLLLCACQVVAYGGVLHRTVLENKTFTQAALEFGGTYRCTNAVLV